MQTFTFIPFIALITQFVQVSSGPACVACAVPCALGPNPACIMCVVTLCPTVCLSNTTYVPVLRNGSYGVPRYHSTLVSDIRVGDYVLGVSDDMRPHATRVVANLLTRDQSSSFVTIVTGHRNMTVTDNHIIIHHVDGLYTPTKASDIKKGDTVVSVTGIGVTDVGVIGVGMGSSDKIKHLLVEDVIVSKGHERYTLVTESGTVLVGDKGSTETSLVVTTICDHSVEEGAPLGDVLSWWREDHKGRFW